MYQLLLYLLRYIIVSVEGIQWTKIGAKNYHAELGLKDKGRSIKGLVVYNSWDLEPWDLLYCLALGCYQPSPEYYSRIIPSPLNSPPKAHIQWLSQSLYTHLVRWLKLNLTHTILENNLLLILMYMHMLVLQNMENVTKYANTF